MLEPITPTARPQRSRWEAHAERPVGARHPTGPDLPVMRRPGGLDTHELRAWGRARGIEVPDRGRLPGELLRAWERATEEAGRSAG
ncbi:Lsr2 family DNA-binding protein [Streptomyces sp. NPDC004285]